MARCAAPPHPPPIPPDSALLLRALLHATRACAAQRGPAVRRCCEGRHCFVKAAPLLRVPLTQQAPTAIHAIARLCADLRAQGGQCHHGRPTHAAPAHARHSQPLAARAAALPDAVAVWRARPARRAAAAAANGRGLSMRRAGRMGWAVHSEEGSDVGSSVHSEEGPAVECAGAVHAQVAEATGASYARMFADLSARACLCRATGSSATRSLRP